MHLEECRKHVAVRCDMNFFNRFVKVARSCCVVPSWVVHILPRDYHIPAKQTQHSRPWVHTAHSRPVSKGPHSKRAQIENTSQPTGCMYLSSKYSGLTRVANCVAILGPLFWPTPLPPPAERSCCPNTLCFLPVVPQIRQLGLA